MKHPLSVSGTEQPIGPGPIRWAAATSGFWDGNYFKASAAASATAFALAAASLVSLKAKFLVTFPPFLYTMMVTAASLFRLYLGGPSFWTATVRGVVSLCVSWSFS